MSGEVVRVYGGAKPDPLEKGPAKRVTHMVDNVGGTIASSKKRASWKFTLGDSDTVHEVILFHSVMSAKKVVSYDGKEQYHHAVITPGDWTLTLMLDNNTPVEVRINEYETPDIPKYDLLINRVAYRKMDVYRRNKKTGSAGHDEGYHQSHWGPGGVESSAPVAPAPGALVREKSGKRAAKDPEINLIDTSMPEVTVPVNTLVFDPLVTTPPLPVQHSGAKSPVNLNAFFPNGQPQNYDPFAAAMQPPPCQAQAFVLPDHLQHHHQQQQQQQQQYQPQQYQQQPTNGYGGFMQMPPPQQIPRQGMVVPGQYVTPPTPNPVYPPSYNPQANLNISNMMNPMQVANGYPTKKANTPDININPFAGMR
ncbi:Aste57867_21963 [Aphanomyces stellatus]|uniref:Aste57867_21963 protein n=1 Tax=Aphanomyces stellatus TaxID=120398 RepID=A0A485LJL7_9STRA|nr:hypothetical protein As57867_021894 [Aphanomyces stellatus]VFT98631.1 Aste57867_21963 [Aphanomyces stellatus]